MGDRKGRPYAGLVAELFGVASHALAASRCVLRARSRVLTHSRTKKRSRAGFEMGDRKGRPYAGFVAELFGA